ncbi:MAG: PEP-CTERM sorting domain-containing protein [Methylobacter sp.]|nr:PEP-CTERM sorting domain-containing protein [Methylobacter sp.]
MSIGGAFQNQYYHLRQIPNNYTGNLPPELIPSTSNQSTVFNSGSTYINWNNNLGTAPTFEAYNTTSLIHLFETMLGSTFSFSQNSSSSLCTYMDPTGNYCYGGQVQLGYDYSGGTAILSSVSSVPVPAAIWLFGTGLIGLLRFKRHKAA